MLDPVGAAGVGFRLGGVVAGGWGTTMGALVGPGTPAPDAMAPDGTFPLGAPLGVPLWLPVAPGAPGVAGVPLGVEGEPEAWLALLPPELAGALGVLPGAGL
jgi:hypothetical protein